MPRVRFLGGTLPSTQSETVSPLYPGNSAIPAGLSGLAFTPRFVYPQVSHSLSASS